MGTPRALAVAVARWTGTLWYTSVGTTTFPPPIPAIPEIKPPTVPSTALRNRPGTAWCGDGFQLVSMTNATKNRNPAIDVRRVDIGIRAARVPAP